MPPNNPKKPNENYLRMSFIELLFLFSNRILAKKEPFWELSKDFDGKFSFGVIKMNVCTSFHEKLIP